MIQKPVINIALLGLGHVGSGSLKLLLQRQKNLAARIGRTLNVSHILVRDPKKYAHIDLQNTLLTTCFDDILNNKNISIVVELMGGEHPAFDYITRCLKAKKHVVTANKEVMAKHQKTFFDLAKKHDVDIYFEAAVAGGIPIIRSLKVGFAANKIHCLHGILNGTTNYILSKIKSEKCEFSTVLKKAQDLGLAEADPHMDVSGLDAAYKLVLLAAVSFKCLISVKDVYYEGIESISLTDMLYAEKLGYGIKLLAIGKHFENKGYSFKVHPTLIPLDHPLCGIHDETNAVFVCGDAVGDALLAGKGAGSEPTASAVVSDIIDLAFDIDSPRSRRNLETDLQSVHCLDITESYSQFYIRLNLEDKAGALEKVSHVLNESGISIAQLLQEKDKNNEAHLIFITHASFEHAFLKAKDALSKLDVVHTIAAFIRVREAKDAG